MAPLLCSMTIRWQIEPFRAKMVPVKCGSLAAIQLLRMKAPAIATAAMMSPHMPAVTM
jgi:hypothetical protein